MSRYFIKLVDGDLKISKEIEKEFLWQEALWDQGITQTPKPISFNASKQIFVSSLAQGESAAKRMFDIPAYRHQVAQIMANFHGLDVL